MRADEIEPPPSFEFPAQPANAVEPLAAPTSSSPSETPTFGPEKQLQASFGQIVTLLLRVPSFQSLPLATLKTAVMLGV